MDMWPWPSNALFRSALLLLEEGVNFIFCGPSPYFLILSVTVYHAWPMNQLFLTMLEAVIARFLPISRHQLHKLKLIWLTSTKKEKKNSNVLGFL